MMETVLRFRQRLSAGDICVGASITFADPLVSDALGDSVDFFWIDLEHSAMSPAALQGHILAARCRQVPALVRVTGSATPFVKPVLDSGADGVIVPQVRSADEVRCIVDDCRYPPLGKRGYGPRVPSNYGRDGGTDYVARANEAIFVAVQVENREALEAIDAIVAVPGLDSIVLGPSDLAASLGHMGNLAHPDVTDAIDRVVARAHRAGLFVGSGMGPDARFAVSMVQRGVQWLQVGGDYSYMIGYADKIIEDIFSKLAQQRPGS